MSTLTLGRTARELAVLAHGRAMMAVCPIIRLGPPSHRDVIYRALAWEFQDFATSVEELLRCSVVSRSGAGLGGHGSGASDTLRRPEADSGKTRRDELAAQGKSRNPGNVNPRPGRPPLACHDRGERGPSAEP